MMKEYKMTRKETVGNAVQYAVEKMGERIKLVPFFGFSHRRTEKEDE